MSTPHPPRLASWLLNRLALGPKRESLIGDLLEQHRRGRSSAWYWRQTFSTIMRSFATEAREHIVLAVGVVALGAYLPRIYMLILYPRWVGGIDRAWYPHVINSRWSWMVTNPWAYRLQLYSLTTRIAWCVLLATVTWLLTRTHPKERRLVVTVFLITQMGLQLPYMRYAFGNWFEDPGNPMWFFNVIWFVIFTLVAIPSSILLGGRPAKTFDRSAGCRV